jgi:molybdopterin-biosynthesis enzyme MoeA-like protein
MSSSRKKQEEKKRKLKERRKRLKRIQNPAAHFANLPAGVQFIKNPPGKEKMSEVLYEFIQPYYEMVHDLRSFQFLVSAGIVAWNAGLFSGSKRKEVIEIFMDTLPAEPLEMRNIVTNMIDDLVQRKERKFADNQRRIINVKTWEERDEYRMVVMSTLE